jgi:tagatose-6-phosphate ketose/aldose isomerase
MSPSTKGSQHSGTRQSSQLDPTAQRSVESWVDDVGSAAGGRLAALLSPSWDEQVAGGYGHTLREILQQPVTWLDTASRALGRRTDLARTLEGVGAAVLTGSGSSLYAGECAAPCLQKALRIPVSAVSAGLILTHPALCLPPSGPYVFVSLARSGNSPESRGVVEWLLEHQPRARHLIITCNRDGALATACAGRSGSLSIVLDERTNDKSLVMTSSFTNLVLAARGLGVVGEKDGRRFEERVLALSRAASTVLRERANDVAALGETPFRTVAFLGSACRLGSAHEAALKLTEMTGGEVWTLPESYLGLRHGPMSALRADTLVVAFLSSDPVVRAYELDLLRELRRKGLGARRLIVGSRLPSELGADEGDVVVDCDSASVLADEDLTVIDVLVGQLLALFRCLGAGYRPDSPSEEGVITRVVSDFEIHRRDGPE